MFQEAKTTLIAIIAIILLILSPANYSQSSNIIGESNSSNNSHAATPQVDHRAKADDKLIATIPADVTDVSFLVFSSNGQNVTYEGSMKGTSYRFLNDTALPDVSSDVVFSPNGRRIAYKVDDGIAQRIVLDGKSGPAFDEVSDPEFSPDSTKIAYAATAGDITFLVIDGRRGPTIEDGVIDGIVFSPDGRTVAYRVVQNHGYYVAVTGRSRGPLYDSVALPIFSPDGKRLAYWAKDGDSVFVTLDNKRMEPAFKKRDILVYTPIVFSPNGRTITYLGWKDDKEFYLIAGKKGPLFDEVGDFTFNANGGHYAYVAHEGDQAFAISTILPGGRSRARYAMWVPAVSSDGRSLAYFFALPGLKKYGVSLNEIDGPLLDGVALGSLSFSSDSRFVMYGAQVGKQLWWKTLKVDK